MNKIRTVILKKKRKKMNVKLSLQINTVILKMKKKKIMTEKENKRVENKDLKKRENMTIY
jgi:hypothetical protein